MLRHWLKRYKLKWDEMQTLGCKMLLFVKKNPTDNTKLETKIIRKTQSTANQFDAETLTKALQAEVGRNADTRLQQVINCQKESNGQHKTGNKNHQKDTIHSKSIWCWDIVSSTTNWSGTKCTDSQLQNVIIVCQRDSYGHQTTGNKNHKKTRSTENHFHAAHWTTYLKKNWNQIHAKSAKTLSLLVKEIPTDITKLETKIIKNSIHKKSISCRHNVPRSWISIETKLRQSQIKHYHCSSRDSYIHHETGTKNHNGGLNLRLSNLMLGHRLIRCYPMCNEMHWHPAAKCYHCLSKRIQRTTQNWEQKSSERHNPQQINLMLRHWLKHYKLKWDEVHRQSATKCYH